MFQLLEHSQKHLLLKERGRHFASRRGEDEVYRDGMGFFKKLGEKRGNEILWEGETLVTK